MCPTADYSGQCPSPGDLVKFQIFKCFVDVLQRLVYYFAQQNPYRYHQSVLVADNSVLHRTTATMSDLHGLHGPYKLMYGGVDNVNTILYISQ